jgi:hypothetical protein
VACNGVGSRGTGTGDAKEGLGDLRRMTAGE